MREPKRSTKKLSAQILRESFPFTSLKGFIFSEKMHHAVFSLKQTERCCFFRAPSTFGSGFFTNPKSRVGNQQLRKSSERCLFVHYMSPFYLCNKKIWQIKTNQTSNTSPHNIQVFLRHEKRNQRPNPTYLLVVTGIFFPGTSLGRPDLGATHVFHLKISSSFVSGPVSTQSATK